jgi:hypothetical protein
MPITGDPVPTSVNAYNGIEFAPAATLLNVLPKGVGAWGHRPGKLILTFSYVGSDQKYELFPHGFTRGSEHRVAYYNAMRGGRSEYVVGPSRLQDFEDNIGKLVTAAGLAFGLSGEAHPSAVHMIVAQRQAMAGKPWEAAKSHMRAIGHMWKDPLMVLTSIAEVGAIGAAKSAKGAKVRTAPVHSAPPPVAGNRIVSPVYRIHGRDIVVVRTSQGNRVFYRSSGKNSGQPGKWFPIDEVWPTDGYFNKMNYTQGPNMGKGQPFERLGNQEFANISEELGKMRIGKGAEIPPGVLESAESTLNRIFDFFNVPITKKTLFRPVPEVPK